MCTFMKTSDLPSGNKNGNQNKNFIGMFMKPTDSDKAYRFRLLYFTQKSKNNRDTPYIVQKYHDHWGTTSKGAKIVDDTVVCPGTRYSTYDDDKWILNPEKGKKELNCPICQKANEAFGLWKSTGYKDKLNMNRYNALKQKTRYIIPVYVINDPVNPKNNRKCKALILTNKSDCEYFEKVVQDEKARAYLSSKTGDGYEIFNGDKGKDLFMRMEMVPEIRNEGKPNQYTAQVRKITLITFGKQAYPLPEINKELIDGFAFDDEYYVSNTKDDLTQFYKKYYGQNETEIPDEDLSELMSANDTQKDQPTVSTENSIQDNHEEPDIDTKEFEEPLVNDPDDLPPTQDTTPPPSQDDKGDPEELTDSEIDNLINGI